MKSKLRLFLLLVSVLMLVSLFVLQSNFQASIGLTEACPLNPGQSCSYNTAQGYAVEITAPATPFELEQINTLKLEITASEDSLMQTGVDLSAHLVGINMNMGKIPLKVIKNQQEYLVEVIPVMCTEPNMKWRVEINISTHGQPTEIKDSLFATFSTLSQ